MLDLEDLLNDIEFNVNRLIDLLSEMHLRMNETYYLDSCAFETSTDDESESFISKVDLIKVSNNSAIEHLSQALRPFYRTINMQTAPRYFGLLNFNGDDNQISLANELVNKINYSKNRWGEQLKDNFPNLLNRQRFLNSSQVFCGVSTRSIYRKLPTSPIATYAAKLSWSCKSFRVEKITIDDIPNLLARYGISDFHLVDEILSKIQVNMSVKSGNDLFHKFPIKIHPVQTVYYNNGNGSKRYTIRPGLPLLSFGAVSIKTNSFKAFDKNIKLRDTKSKRFAYEEIIPELGIVQKILA